MTFEIGDKVETTSGLYMDGVWREAGTKGKVVGTANDFGLLTVKFKGAVSPRFIRAQYLTLREKPEDLGFEAGDTVVFKKAFEHGMSMEVAEGIWAEVVKVHRKTGEVTVEFDDYSTLRVPAELLSTEDHYFDGEEEETDEPDFDSEDPEETPEEQDTLGLILDRLEEIKTLLTEGPKNEVHIYTSAPASDESLLTEQEEEPAPEPVFKKAKEVKAGDSLYTEAGVWDKVSRVETKDSGYTSLFGAFGNKIVQVPSGRPLQVLEEVS